jgi:photosystem II stability/assembly factor-like uncharacterized protein
LSLKINRVFVIDMWRSFFKASLLVLMVSLCMSVPIVNAEGVVLNWTSPTTEILFSVFMVSADDGWAVGAYGIIIHWNGTEWNAVTSPTTRYLWSVYMVSSSDGWAVGDYETIIHWDGTSWNNVTSPIPPRHPFYSVFMVGADDGWAVGELGAIIHWNGTSWSNVTSPTTMRLNSVFMVSADDGWAVGAGGTIIHWNGTEWSFVASVLSSEYWWLLSMYMVSSSDGWAVGDSGAIFRWTGTEWIPEFPVAILMPLLISLTLVAVILAKTASKKRRKPSLPSKTQCAR